MHTTVSDHVSILIFSELFHSMKLYVARLASILCGFFFFIGTPYSGILKIIKSFNGMSFEQLLGNQVTVGQVYNLFIVMSIRYG